MKSQWKTEIKRIEIKTALIAKMIRQFQRTLYDSVVYDVNLILSENNHFSWISYYFVHWIKKLAPNKE